MDTMISSPLVEFVTEELRVSSSRLRPNTRLFHDLGVDGDDGPEFIDAFARRFGVDLTGFDPSLHFGPEAAGNPLLWAWWFITCRWPTMIPISLSDLQASLDARRWVAPQHAAV
jgi:hypothetical protein